MSFCLNRFDPDLVEIIESLESHITSNINLVGSATLPMREVSQLGSLPGTACRVEGQLGERYFPATEPMDLAEKLVSDRVRRLFGLGDGYEVNAQPHSPTQANQAAFHAVLTQRGASDETGKVAGMASSDGGHISHLFALSNTDDFIVLPVVDTGIDYEAARETVLQNRPTMIVVGGTSYPLGVDYPKLREMADLVGAHLHADLAHSAPFVAAGIHPRAFPYVDSATIDVTKNLRGAGGGILAYRQEHARRMRRAIFPVIQSSPNKSGLLTKAACLATWTPENLKQHASNMVRIARLLSQSIEGTLGAPVFGGTESHLLLFDVTHLGMDGRQAEKQLARAGILVNRNQIPNDQRTPLRPSGIRLSSTVPAILEYRDEDVNALGRACCSVLEGRSDGNDTIARLLTTYHRPAAEHLMPTCPLGCQCRQ